VVEVLEVAESAPRLEVAQAALALEPEFGESASGLRLGLEVGEPVTVPEPRLGPDPGLRLGLEPEFGESAPGLGLGLEVGESAPDPERGLEPYPAPEPEVPQAEAESGPASGYGPSEPGAGAVPAAELGPVRMSRAAQARIRAMIVHAAMKPRPKGLGWVDSAIGFPAFPPVSASGQAWQRSAECRGSYPQGA
jgi:hypothetical protein